MIEAEYSIELALPPEDIWRYVEVIPNWAPLVVGFQKLELVDDRRSRWTLRGDVGILARDVEIQADITRWEPPAHAEFQLTGVTERLSGQGTFHLTPLPDAAGREPAGGGPGPVAGSPGATATGQARPETGGLLRRIQFALAGLVLRRLRRRLGPPAASPAGGGPAPAAPGPGGGSCRLTFRLEMAPGGPMAPMFELLMRPMVEPAAQDFLQGLRQALEGDDRREAQGHEETR